MTSLRNIEEDEAGKLRAFRQRFGRGWDAESTPEEGEEGVDAGYNSLYFLYFARLNFWFAWARLESGLIGVLKQGCGTQFNGFDFRGEW